MTVIRDEDRRTGVAGWVEPAANSRTSERVRRAVDTIAVVMRQSGADRPVDNGPRLRVVCGA